MTISRRISWDGKPLAANLVDGEQPAVEPEGFDPGEHTVDDVVAYVADHPDELDAVLAAERAGKARVTLLAVLEPTNDDG